MNSVYEGFGLRVKFRRELMGLTEEKVADAVGVYTNTVKAIESGNHMVTLGLAIDIAKLLKEDLTTLVFGDSKTVKPIPDSAFADVSKICENCQWYNAHKGSSFREGVCRRYPRDRENGHPSVFGEDWCGEFTATMEPRPKGIEVRFCDGEKA